MIHSKTTPLKFKTYHSWQHVYGYGKLFSAITHNGAEQYKDNKYDPNYGNCLSFYTERQSKDEQSVLLGSKSVADARKVSARWMAPVGVQFKWCSSFSHRKAMGMGLRDLCLIYVDNWAPHNLLFAPIQRNYKITNSNTYTIGTDLFAKDVKADDDAGVDSEDARLGNNRAGGEVIGFVEDDCIDVIKDRYTRCACIGIYVSYHVVKYDPAKYDKIHNWWDFKLLFDTDRKAENSRIIIPQPHLLSDRIDDGKVKLL